MSQLIQSIRLENTQAGNHKYYEMHDNGDGSWTAYYARIGHPPRTARYSVSSWNCKYKEKLKKGYIDVTAKTGTLYGSVRSYSAIQQSTTGTRADTGSGFSMGWVDPNGKYDISGETKDMIINGEKVKLWRISSRREFIAADGHKVEFADRGGWIQCPENLREDAWVADEAIVFGMAVVDGNALVCGHAKIGDEAHVTGNAQVKDEACIIGSAEVSGEAIVYQNAVIGAYALVHDRSCVGGNSLVTDNAEVKDDAWVCGKAGIYGTRIVGGNIYIE